MFGVSKEYKLGKFLNTLSGILDTGSNIYGIINNEREWQHQKEVDEFNKEMAQKNYQLAVDQMNWQQQAQMTAWDREDNAIRRRVADLQAAGMSKWLAAGQGAQAGGVTASNVTSGANLINSGAKLKDVNLKNAVDSFLTGSERQSGISLTQTQEDLVEANIDNVKQDTINKSYGANKTLAETEKIYQDMQNSIDEISLLKSQFDEQVKLWETQKNKNSAEADKIKSEIERIGVEVDLKKKELQAYDTYLNMDKERHEDTLKTNKSIRGNAIAGTVKDYVYGLSNEIRKWVYPYSK